MKISQFILCTLCTVFLFSACNDEPELKPVGFGADFLSSEPIVSLNPNQNSPLVAVLEMDFKTSGEYTITVQGEEPYVMDGTFTEATAGLPIKGLYPNTENKVHLELRNSTSVADTVFLIQTAPLPNAFPTVTIDKSLSSADQRWTLCEFSAGQGSTYRTYPFIVDGNGDIRWYGAYPTLPRLIYPIYITDKGYLVLANGANVYVYDFMGNEIQHFNMGKYHQHHETFINADGNYIFGGTIPAEQRNEDVFLEVSQSGNVLHTWDMKKILDVDRDDLNITGNDWFHLNAIYEEADGSFLVSGRNQGVVKMNRENELIWILAPHKGWGKAGADGNGIETSDYLLTAIDAEGKPFGNDVQMGLKAAEDFDWPWGQHAVMRLKNGNILLFDNGFKRQFGNAAVNYSRAVEYVIDEENMTVQQVWEYGKERGEALFSTIISDVDELPSGNILMSAGFLPDGSAKIVEIAYPEKTEVFEMTVKFKNLNSNNGQGWGGADIMYRAEKIAF